MRKTPDVPGKGTRRHAVRVPDELWRAALAAAKQRGDTLNGVIRAALERYLSEERPDGGRDR